MARDPEWDVPTNTTPKIDFGIVNEERHGEALDRAWRMKREQETATPGRAFARDVDKANAFSKLSRYETAIERQLYKALHELECRQAARQSGSVPPPQVVDVDVTGIPEGVPEGDR